MVVFIVFSQPLTDNSQKHFYMVSTSSSLDWQKEIYLNGFAGKKLSVPIDFQKLEARAKQVMTTQAFAYIAGGAGSESTVNNNHKAFEKFFIVPRMLNDVGERDTTIELFGTKFDSPFFLAPIGVLDLVHREADVEVARAAARANVPYIFSNQASRPMEECASVMGKTPRFFQLYWSKSNDLVSSFLQRAEKINCTGIIVTLDTTMLGWRTRDLDLAYLPFLEGRGIAQYTSDPVFQKMLDEPDQGPEVERKISWQTIQGLVNMMNHYPGSGFLNKLRSGRPIKAVRKFIATYSNPRTTWADLEFLRTQTKLPIILKGILHPDDARKAMDYGMDGIVISNHGGRQVDGAIPTFDALPDIVKVVDKKISVILDGGIRGGADAFKALALGADAVCIGRPYVYGLAISGQLGVYEVIRNVQTEFELTMGLAGCKNIREINQKSLKPAF
jgi:lactate 2-monooxygenase